MGVRIKAETEEGEQAESIQRDFLPPSGVRLELFKSFQPQVRGKGCVHTVTSFIGSSRELSGSESRNVGKRDSRRDSKSKAEGCLQLRTMPCTSQNTKNS